MSQTGEISALKILFGLISGFGLTFMLATMFVGGAFAFGMQIQSQSTAFLWFIASFGLWQWLYLGPLLWLAWRKMERSLAIGTLLGSLLAGALASLISTGCGGFFLLISTADFR
ncbi:MAG: hypothetical protein U0166_22430 [Acidobacteriota bacterium]